LYRDPDKVVAHGPRSSSRPTIAIYSCAGKLLRSIPWDKGPIVSLGWADDERLLVVTRDGTVRCYLNFDGEFTQFSLGSGADEYGVSSCRFFDTGFVALLANNALVSVSSYEEPRPKLLASCPDGRVHAWAAVPPAYTLSKSVEVLVATGQTVCVVDATDCEDRGLDVGPFTHISVSPNGRFVALYAGTGHAHVVTSDFQVRLSEHDSRSRIPPNYLHWCGSDAVVIAWEDEVRVLGPGGSAAKFFYDARVHVIQGTADSFAQSCRLAEADRMQIWTACAC
jgi:vacuolar protein sorting-associated protein 16